MFVELVNVVTQSLDTMDVETTNSNNPYLPTKTRDTEDDTSNKKEIQLEDTGFSNLRNNIILLNKEFTPGTKGHGSIGTCLNSHIKVWVFLLLVVIAFTLGAILASAVTAHKSVEHCVPCAQKQVATQGKLLENCFFCLHR